MPIRRAAKVDMNQPAIVSGLRSVGASVQLLHTVGGGCPDLLVGFRGQNYLLEVKNAKSADEAERKLESDQREFFARWRGNVAVIATLDHALRVIGAVT
jgi:hypothetical protein